MNSTPFYPNSVSVSSSFDLENGERRSHWVKDEDYNKCTSCQANFTITKWKHHCRSCGKVFCAECSNSRIRLPEHGYTDKVRVCDDCCLTRCSNQTTSLQDELDVKQAIVASLKKALKKKSEVINSFRKSLISIESCLSRLSFDMNGSFKFEPSNSIDSFKEDNFDDLIKNIEAGIFNLSSAYKTIQRQRTEDAKNYSELNAECVDKENKMNKLNSKLITIKDELASFKNLSAERDQLLASIENHKFKIRMQQKKIDNLKKIHAPDEYDNWNMNNHVDLSRNFLGFSDTLDNYSDKIDDKLFQKISQSGDFITKSKRQNKGQPHVAISYTLSEGLNEPLSGMNNSYVRRHSFSHQKIDFSNAAMKNSLYKLCCHSCKRRLRKPLGSSPRITTGMRSDSRENIFDKCTIQ